MKTAISYLILIALFITISSCKKDELNTEKTITDFEVSNVIGVINESAKTITLTVSNRAILTNLAPTISISAGAIISPGSNTPQDFNTPVKYTVTAEDGTTTNYTVSTEQFYSFNFNNHFYEVVKENKEWQEAVSFATNLGGYLVEINTAEEQDAVFSELDNNAGITITNTQNKFSRSAVWLGGNDLDTEGKWVWNKNDIQFWEGGINGTPVNNLYNNWGDEPDDAEGQDVLSISLEDTPRNKKGEWNDLNGDANQLFFVIEYDQ